MGEKYLRIDFNQGEQWKVNLKTVATLIANKEFDGKVKGNLDDMQFGSEVLMLRRNGLRGQQLLVLLNKYSL